MCTGPKAGPAEFLIDDLGNETALEDAADGGAGDQQPDPALAADTTVVPTPQEQHRQLAGFPPRPTSSAV